MHPFFKSTRASMIFCPTTKCSPSKGLRGSTLTEFHGTCRNSALRLPFATVPFSATLFPGRAACFLLGFTGADAFRTIFFFIGLSDSSFSLEHFTEHITAPCTDRHRRG